jgi:hypothetical protein
VLRDRGGDDLAEVRDRDGGKLLGGHGSPLSLDFAPFGVSSTDGASCFYKTV